MKLNYSSCFCTLLIIMVTICFAQKRAHGTLRALIYDYFISGGSRNLENGTSGKRWIDLDALDAFRDDLF